MGMLEFLDQLSIDLYIVKCLTFLPQMTDKILIIFLGLDLCLLNPGS